WNQINVGWQDNSSNESGFEVYRSTTGPSGAFSLVATAGANATSYGNGGLAGSTQYCYEVRAFRTTGGKTTYSAFSSAACATTPAVPVPSAPSAVNAAPRLGYAFDITWTDNSAVEDGFTVSRAGGGADWSVVATLRANTTAYHDAGLTTDNTYWYAVYAMKDGGSSGSSEAAQVVLATTPPVAPSGLGVQ